eukprot:gnl/TRDRNA2_/TRDRNA2_186700_c0_seq1.p2 gnl/TRDRNA2_/TRDRNA2_186700_c0~~gnl/TRDRNA2_/TRDRNA2_186700_c0_seq1.p2  ORF type:complete len:160 (+),score=17.77 gnl/TRDRNA2_/TRDRNA2_186700_c0_seq1:60-482(+)
MSAQNGYDDSDVETDPGMPELVAVPIVEMPEVPPSRGRQGPLGGGSPLQLGHLMQALRGSEMTEDQQQVLARLLGPISSVAAGQAADSAAGSDGASSTAASSGPGGPDEPSSQRPLSGLIGMVNENKANDVPSGKQSMAL